MHLQMITFRIHVLVMRFVNSDHKVTMTMSYFPTSSQWLALAHTTLTQSCFVNVLMTVLATPLAILNFSPFIDKLKQKRNLCLIKNKITKFIYQMYMLILCTFESCSFNGCYLQSMTITTSFGPLVAAIYQGRTLGS